MLLGIIIIALIYLLYGYSISVTYGLLIYLGGGTLSTNRLVSRFKYCRGDQCIGFGDNVLHSFVTCYVVIENVSFCLIEVIR